MLHRHCKPPVIIQHSQAHSADLNPTEKRTIAHHWSKSHHPRDPAKIELNHRNETRVIERIALTQIGDTTAIESHRSRPKIFAFPCLIRLDSQENRPFSGKNPACFYRTRHRVLQGAQQY